MSDDLKRRVEQFNALELPGQPMGMHMGTAYLVSDLMREIERLRATLAESIIFSQRIADNEERLTLLNAELLAALEPFAHYAVMRAAKPFLGLHDDIHRIHTGTEWEAVISLSDCERARAASAKAKGETT